MSISFPLPPIDIVIEILIWCDKRELNAFFCTCGQLRVLSNDNELWRRRLSKYLGHQFDLKAVNYKYITLIVYERSIEEQIVISVEMGNLELFKVLHGRMGASGITDRTTITSRRPIFQGGEPRAWRICPITEAERRLSAPHPITDGSKTVHLPVLAATYGHLQLIKYFLEVGMNIHVQEDAALHAAVKNGHIEVVKFLLEHGDLIISDLTICQAAVRGYVDMMELFFTKDLIPSRILNTAFSEAVKNGQLEMVRLMLEHGADVNFRGLIFYQASTGCHLELMKFLLSKQASIGPYSTAATRCAIDLNNLPTLKFLVEQGIYDNLTDSVSRAAAKGHLEMVKLLVSAGADVLGSDLALMEAAKYGQLDVVKFLVEVNNSNQIGQLGPIRLLRALEFAEEDGHLGVVSFLLAELRAARI